MNILKEIIEAAHEVLREGRSSKYFNNFTVLRSRFEYEVIYESGVIVVSGIRICSFVMLTALHVNGIKLNLNELPAENRRAAEINLSELMLVPLLNFIEKRKVSALKIVTGEQ